MDGPHYGTESLQRFPLLKSVGLQGRTRRTEAYRYSWSGRWVGQMLVHSGVNLIPGTGRRFAAISMTRTTSILRKYVLSTEYALP
jgi:hypothetical protein